MEVGGWSKKSKIMFTRLLNDPQFWMQISILKWDFNSSIKKILVAKHLAMIIRAMGLTYMQKLNFETKYKLN